jgi:L-aspartate oxidase
VNELLTRDEVSRAVFRELTAESGAAVFLDVRHLPPDLLQKKFRHVYSTCLHYGLDITRNRIPITPAAHYFMGGVRTDLHGRTNLRGLYAAGEVASTGVHGANRLASNSLLEALVFGGRTATAMREEEKLRRPRFDADAPAASSASFQRIRDITWRHAGIVRSASGLKTGAELLAAIPEDSNLLTVARMIHQCALTREESRGAHYRDDFPSRYTNNLHSYISKTTSPRLA